jgi:hypothetical protein
MKVPGFRTRDMGEAMNVSLIEILMRVSTSTVKLVGGVCTLGRMEMFMMVSGWMGRSMAMAIGLTRMVIRSLVAGSMEWRMDMEFISGQMVTDTKVNGNTH